MPIGELDEGMTAKQAYSAATATQFFTSMAQHAADIGAIVDVLAVGNAAANAALLTAVTQRSGGVMLLHEGAAPVGSPLRIHSQRC